MHGFIILVNARFSDEHVCEINVVVNGAFINIKKLILGFNCTTITRLFINYENIHPYFIDAFVLFLSF